MYDACRRISDLSEKAYLMVGLLGLSAERQAPECCCILSKGCFGSKMSLGSWAEIFVEGWPVIKPGLIPFGSFLIIHLNSILCAQVFTHKTKTFFKTSVQWSHPS